MELEKIYSDETSDIYAISAVRREFRKAVGEDWREKPPWKRYQKKLLEDLAVLSRVAERAIELPQFEKLVGEADLYSIRHPESKKNPRVIYTRMRGVVILLVAFLEKNDGDYQRAIKTAKIRLTWLKC